MKVLVSDPLSNEGLEILKEHFTVDVSTGLSEDDLVIKIPDYDALVIRSGTQVTQKIIEAADNLKVIGRAGVGVDNVDVDAATKKGIIVTNAPEGNMISAAEHTIAMMMAMSRNIPQANASLKAREWKRNKFMGVEVKGKILGIIGLGRIGSEVAKRASGLEMKLMGYDPFISEKRATELGVKLATVNEIAKAADYITVHFESACDIKSVVKKIKAAGLKAGVFIKPKTPVSRIFPLLPLLDLVLVMSVEPGFGGQSFMPAMMPKVKTLRELIDSKKLDCRLEVDGGIDPVTAKQVVEAGADVLVAGTASFKGGEEFYASNISALRGDF